jgi:hypothetical protein
LPNTGYVKPYADWSRAKYNRTGSYQMAQLVNLEELIPFSSSLTAEANKCIMAALSRRTWAKYGSAWNAFKKFEKQCRKNSAGLWKKKLTEVLQLGASRPENFQPAQQERTSQH